MGQLAGVVMDSAGNCYADAFDQNGAVGLWVYNNCTGTGTELTSSNGFNEGYYGGLDVDSSGNLVVVSLLNSSFSTPSTVTVYSGCNTGTCSVQGGPFNLQGESEFGHLGYESERWTTVDITSSAVEVYAYNGQHGGGSTIFIASTMGSHARSTSANRPRTCPDPKESRPEHRSFLLPRGMPSLAIRSFVALKCFFATISKLVSA